MKHIRFVVFFLLLLQAFVAVCDDNKSFTNKSTGQHASSIGTTKTPPSVPRKPIQPSKENPVNADNRKESLNNQQTMRKKTDVRAPVPQRPEDVIHAAMQGMQPDLKQTYRRSEEIFRHAIHILKDAKSALKDKLHAVQLLERAIEEGQHSDAKMYLGDYYLFRATAELNLTRVRHYYHQLAKEGHHSAQQRLGFLYAQQIIDHEVSPAQAVTYHMFAAMEPDSDPLSHFFLGYRAYYGIDVPMSCDLAAHHYFIPATQAAVAYKGFLPHQDDRDDRDNILSLHPPPPSPNTPMGEDVVHYYQYAAENNHDANAQTLLGQFYYYGLHGIPRNEHLALQYFMRASESGDDLAATLLGTMYWRGDGGLPKNESMAKILFERGASKNFPAALNGLGIIALLHHDEALAFQYFRNAVDIGRRHMEVRSLDAEVHLGLMFLHGRGVPRNYYKAAMMLSPAAAQGHLVAEYNLALMYLYAVGADRNCDHAVKMLKHVAEQGPLRQMFVEAKQDFDRDAVQSAVAKYSLLAELGHAQSQHNLAYILEKRYVDMEESKADELALLYWMRAAQQGDVEARVRSADYLFHGWGTPIDIPSAAELYLQAVEEKNAQAAFSLGYLFHKGYLAKDNALARFYYEKARLLHREANIPVKLALLLMSFEEFIVSSKVSARMQLLLAYWDSCLLAILLVVVAVLFQYRRRLVMGQRVNRENL